MKYPLPGGHSSRPPMGGVPSPYHPAQGSISSPDQPSSILGPSPPTAAPSTSPSISQ
jgi:hypothetical protein